MRWTVGELRQRAAALEALAVQVEDHAADIEDRRDVAWVSARAEEFREDLSDLGRDTLVEAGVLRDAAAAFRAHADEVEATLDAIDRARDAFLGALASARNTIANGLDAVGDAAHDAAERVISRASRAPDDHSLDWLTW